MRVGTSSMPCKTLVSTSQGCRKFETASLWHTLPLLLRRELFIFCAVEATLTRAKDVTADILESPVLWLCVIARLSNEASARGQSLHVLTIINLSTKGLAANLDAKIRPVAELEASLTHL